MTPLDMHTKIQSDRLHVRDDLRGTFIKADEECLFTPGAGGGRKVRAQAGLRGARACPISEYCCPECNRR